MGTSHLVLAFHFCEEKNVQDCKGPWKFKKKFDGPEVEMDAFVITCGKNLK